MIHAGSGLETQTFSLNSAIQCWKSSVTPPRTRKENNADYQVAVLKPYAATFIGY